VDKVVPEPLESPHEPVPDTLGVQLIEVIAADLAILGSVSNRGLFPEYFGPVVEIKDMDDSEAV
jgi:hypothetical protein